MLNFNNSKESWTISSGRPKTTNSRNVILALKYKYVIYTISPICTTLNRAAAMVDSSGQQRPLVKSAAHHLGLEDTELGLSKSCTKHHPNGSTSSSRVGDQWSVQIENF